MSENKKSLVKSGMILSVMTFASRIMGLIREMTKAAFLGTSAYADAFGIAFMIPNLFRRLFAENSISVAFIPTFKGYLEETKNAEEEQKPQLKTETQSFVSSTLTLVTFLTACVTVLGIILANFIVPLFFKGDSDALLLKEASLLTRIMFPYLFVISIAAFFQGVLNGEGIFAPSGFTPVIFNALVIGSTYILTPIFVKLSGNRLEGSLSYEALSARAMSIGVLTGGIFQAIFQWPFVHKTGWKTSLTTLKNAFTNPGTRKVIALIIPTIVGMAAYQLNDAVSTAVAGKIATGTVASLQYSLRLQELILGIFAVSIGTVILPDLSGLAKNKNWEAFNTMLTAAVKIIILITVPVTFYSLVCGKELISVIYKTRSFDDGSVLQTLEVFRYHIAGLLFIAANRIITPAFYSQSNTKLPTLAGIISMVVNMILAVVLSIFMKGRGIALALSASSAVNTVLLFIFMRKLPSLEYKKLAVNLFFYTLKITAFSVVASVPVWFLRPILLEAFSGRNRFFSFGLPVVISAVIFGITGVLLLLIFRDKTALSVTGKLKSKLRHSK